MAATSDLATFGASLTTSSTPSATTINLGSEAQRATYAAGPTLSMVRGSKNGIVAVFFTKE